jgi:hypothetical protein
MDKKLPQRPNIPVKNKIALMNNQADPSRSTSRQCPGPNPLIIFFDSISKARTIQIGPSQGYFADEVAIWKTSSNIKAIEAALQESLRFQSLYWMNTWRMKISTQKTVYCIFNKGSQKIEVNLTYKGNKINADYNARFLESTLIQDLNCTSMLR